MITSLTKYCSAGSCIGGAVLGDSTLMKNVSDTAMALGIHYGPVQCEMVLLILFYSFYLKPFCVLILSKGIQESSFNL